MQSKSEKLLASRCIVKNYWKQSHNNNYYNFKDDYFNLILYLESDCLGLNKSRKVQRIIWEARTQWYNLGLELDITPDSLDSIELANSGKPDRYFRAMLT